jgi:hypothetical protein
VVALHTPLWQSVATLQASPVAHFPQLPPQSASVSAPFLIWSVQLGA